MTANQTTQSGKGIVFEILSTFRGHKTGVYVEDTTNMEQRAELGKKVTEMIKDGYDIFLIDSDRITFRIKEYDAEKNEWIIYSTKVETPAPPMEEAEPKRRGRKAGSATARVAADGTKTTAVARSAGG